MKDPKGYGDKFWRLLNITLFTIFMTVGVQMVINQKALVGACWFMLAFGCISEYQSTIKK